MSVESHVPPGDTRPLPRQLKVALFSLAVFSSAFLIFIVQPMVGKHVVPWFGGVPAVWMLCLCFYQSTLFAGYAYAHLLASRARPVHQLTLYALLFAASLCVLPVLPGPEWKPVGGTPPSLYLLAMLTANVALPFLLLAATAPLLQAWYARVFPGRSPYGLYAVSNAGSLLALISYPFVFEPHWPLSFTSQVWSGAFAVCGLSVLACAWLAGRSRPLGAPTSTPNADSSSRVAGVDIALWIALPACAVVLLMGVTNELCLDVASIPFLWIAPLAIYLLTFILSFGVQPFYRRGAFALPAATAIAAVIVLRIVKGSAVATPTSAMPIALFAGLYSAALFLNCMLLHGELYRLRPPPARLTLYYLCISGGGALGGVFVGILAPRIFSEYFELPIGWMSCWLLFAFASIRRPGAMLHTHQTRRVFVGFVALSVALMGTLAARSRGDFIGALLYQKRSFFTVLRVIERRSANPRTDHVRLKSGTTTHGAQLLQPDLRQVPILYFGSGTGIGLTMQARSDAPMRVGIIGLGVGSLAAYGRAGDDYRFYEIDPDVVRIARDSGYFTYLTDSRATIEYVLGDARLSLESELERGGPQNFDLLVLDAFTSDAIPVHLLTVEAFDLYLAHLKPDGLLAAHISSVNFDLRPLLFRQAAAHGLQAVAVSSGYVPRYLQYSAEWVILSADRGRLEQFPRLVRKTHRSMHTARAALYLTFPDPDLVNAAPLWTDDYSDLFSALNLGIFDHLD